jgi:pantoate--beta-alanine ligase
MAELAAAGFRPEYFSIRRAKDLNAPQVGDTTLQLLVAAWLGPARLIDNLRIELPEPLKIA